MRSIAASAGEHLSEPYDIAVVGSGFAGSLLAMICHRVGRRVVLLERGKHPRFTIGESSTPLSNLLLEELAVRYDLPSIKPLTKWGSWQDTHLELACGIKRGFTFVNHADGRPSSTTIDRKDQLLVAASPHNAIADTHWYREHFDHFLVREAQRLGVEYVDEIDLREYGRDGGAVCLEGVRNGRAAKIKARFVVDATGPRGFLHKVLKLSERALPNFPATETLYSHFAGVRRIEELSTWNQGEQLPYPIDDAAMHHVFEGGWAWVLHFNNGVTSAGVAAANELAKQLTLHDGARAWERLLAKFPALQEQFADAKPIRPFQHIPRMSFRTAAITGEGWALLPSAAGFVDPLLSTGFPLTLLGVSRLAEIIERDWCTEEFNSDLDAYSRQMDTELLATSRLIGALYANMGNFPVFAALSLLYFAAASYSEAARRLGKTDLASSFLMHDHPQFGPNCARLLERARAVRRGVESEKLIEDVFRTIEPIDVAGLGDRDRGNWYPVEAEDLLRSAHKVGASREEVVKMLDRCGFYSTTLPV